MNKMVIRQEKPEDINDIRALNEMAFGQPQEANIIEKLRINCDNLLSLVAIENEKVVAHILFSPVEIKGQHGLSK